MTLFGVFGVAGTEFAFNLLVFFLLVATVSIITLVLAPVEFAPFVRGVGIPVLGAFDRLLVGDLAEGETPFDGDFKELFCCN